MSRPGSSAGSPLRSPSKGSLQGSDLNLGLSRRMSHADSIATKQEAEWDEEDRNTLKGRIFFWWRSYSIEFRELIVYMCFLALYMAVSFGPSGTTMDRYELKAHLSSNIYPSFTDVGSAEGFYSWLSSELLPNLYGDEWSTRAPAASGKVAGHFAQDGVNRRVGTVRLRLVRVQDRAEDLPAVYADAVEHLYPDLLPSFGNLDTQPYVVGGYTGTLVWASGSELGNRGETLCSGTGASYPPSGYVVDLPEGLGNATRVVAELESDALIDLATRAVLVEFALYNANTDQFAVVALVCQFLATGLVAPEAKVSVAPLLSTYRVLTGDSASWTWTWLTFAEVGLYVLVILLIKKERLVYLAIGKEHYFEDGFAVLDLVNYFFFMVVMLLRANLMYNLWYLSDELAADDGERAAAAARGRERTLARAQ